jgi:uncharacterized protein
MPDLAAAPAGRRASAPTRKRSAPLDALRGFALMGIILVNAPFFAGPLRNLVPGNALDAAALWLTAAFAAGKFFLIFSFLFGFGFGTILARAEAQGEDVRGRFLRRLSVLFAFGALHAWLLFLGDILMLYAVLGLALWACRGWPARRLLAVAAIIYLVGVALQTLALQAAVENSASQSAPIIGQGYLGGFWDAAAQRLAELPDSLAFILAFNGAPALAMFLAGLALGRGGLFPPDKERLSKLRPLVHRCLAAGAAISGVAACAPFLTAAASYQAAAFAVLCLAAPLLSFGMAGAFLALAMRHEENRVVRWLAKTGGSSLSGYILHSVLFGAIFTGWGLGFYGALGPAAVLAIALGVFAAIVAALNFWRRFFRFGPDEWLLRSIVDLEWKPMRNG